MHAVIRAKIIYLQIDVRTSTLAGHGSSKSHFTALKQLKLQSQFKKAVAKSRLSMKNVSLVTIRQKDTH